MKDKPSTRTDIRDFDATLGENHPHIQEPEYDDANMPPEGIFDCEPETEREYFWRQWNATDGEDF